MEEERPASRSYGSDSGREGDDIPGRRERVVATGLLLLACGLFGATFLDPTPGFWTLLARHAAEAGIAGGVADWFAVVALFRRPLGLPIPHTGIIPRNKERIARGLGRFVETHFLSPDTVAGRLRAADLSGSAARWLVDPQNAAAVADRTVQLLAAVAAHLPDRELRALVRTAAVRGFAAVDLAAVLAMSIDAARESGRHHELFDALLATARSWVDDNPDRIATLIGQRSAWWVPKVVDRGVGRALVDEARHLLNELAAPDSDARHGFDRLVRSLARDLREQPRVRERMALLQRELLASERLQQALDGAADEVRGLLLQTLAENRTAARALIAEAVRALGRRLSEDEGLRERLERRMVWLARSVVQPWRTSIGRFIAEVMSGWETRTVADRLEAAVSRDLQYVRINGTLVGSLVGGLLYMLTYALR